MRKFILLLTVLVATAFAGAAQVSLRVQHVNGGESVFLLDKQPEVAFLAGKLSVKVPDEEGVAFELDDIASIDFLGKSGIETAEAAGGVTVAVSGGLVTFGNIPDGSRVEVYNAAGSLVMASKASESLSISRSEIPAGVYIVKINNFVTKVSL